MSRQPTYDMTLDEAVARVDESYGRYAIGQNATALRVLVDHARATAEPDVDRDAIVRIAHDEYARRRAADGGVPPASIELGVDVALAALAEQRAAGGQR